MVDQFRGYRGAGIDKIGPAEHAVAIVPSDTTDLAFLTRGLYLGVSGDVRVRMADGQVITFVGMNAGTIHPLRVARVFATGTTATDFVGVY